MGGVCVQLLRDVDLLLIAPWQIAVPDSVTGRPLHAVHIANPVSYIVHKLLVSRRRSKSDQAKDLLYLYDTLMLFGARMQDLQAIWERDVKNALTAKQRRELRRQASLVLAESEEIIRDAAKMAQEVGRPVQPEILRRTVIAGLRAIGITQD